MSADVAGTGWRPIFLVNVPIGAVLTVLAGRHLPPGGGQVRRRLDSLGVVTSSAAVLALVVPLVLGHEEGWPAWGWAAMAASVLLFRVFAAVNDGLALRGPLVSGRILRTPGLVVGTGTIFLAMSANSRFLFAFSLYLQNSLHLSAPHTGLISATTAAGTGSSSLTWSRLPAPWHRWLVPIGMTGAAAYLLLAPLEHSGRLNDGWLAADLFAPGIFSASPTRR